MWEKAGKTVNAEGTTIVYSLTGTEWTVESRKRHIPHANGNSGTWDFTNYVVLRAGKECISKSTLASAKEFAEKKAYNGIGVR